MQHDENNTSLMCSAVHSALGLLGSSNFSMALNVFAGCDLSLILHDCLHHIPYTVLKMEDYPVGFHRASIGFANEGRQTVRNIPELIEYNAKFNPDYTFCVQAEKALDDGSAGLLHVTHNQLKHAVLCCSRWLKSLLHELVLPQTTKERVDNRKGPPIALLLDSDINLLIHVYALISLGVPVSEIRAVTSMYY